MQGSIRDSVWYCAEELLGLGLGCYQDLHGRFAEGRSKSGVALLRQMEVCRIGYMMSETVVRLPVDGNDGVDRDAVMLMLVRSGNERNNF